MQEIQQINIFIYLSDFDILNVTGFSNIFNIYRKLRPISIGNSENIMKSLNGSFYDLGNNTMVKVYKKGHQGIRSEKNELWQKRLLRWEFPL